MNFRQRIDEPWDLVSAPSAGSPIFILGCGWRCGSTLLQRMVVSSGEALIWGEPLARCGFLQLLGNGLSVIDSAYPERIAVLEEHLDRHEGDPWTILNRLQSNWIANMHPHPRHVKTAMRNFFDALLSRPALDLGYRRFGLKGVRLAAQQLALIEWLYPDARAIFLVRNPLDCWRSAKPHAADAYWKMPFQPPVTDAAGYANLWNAIATSFLARGEGDALLFVRFEDLTEDPSAIGRIETHLDLKVDRAVMNRGVRGPVREPMDLSREEIETIEAVCGANMRRLGY